MRVQPQLRFVIVLLFGVSWLASCSDPATPENRGPFNLVVISIDTLRADHLGAYGYARPTTPNIDALALDSVVFQECIASAPTTLASHASIFTSLLPHQHGASIARQTGLAEGIPTLAEVLREQGYATGAFNGGGQLSGVYGLQRGFEVYESVRAKRLDVPILQGREYRLEAGVDWALAWIRSATSPFFLFLHSYEIHHPYNPDASTLQTFDLDYRGNLPDHISVDLLRQINSGRRTISKADLQHIVSTYDAELSSSDAAVGAFVDALRREGRYDDTMIVVTSDHGEEFAEHGQVGWHHDTLYDELLRVPLIVKFPRSQYAGRRVEWQVRGIDVAPTALAALAIQAPESFAGEALGDWIESGEPPELPAVSMSDGADGRTLWSLRSGNWKLHDWRGEKLFDLGSDPKERMNLATKYPERVAALRRMAETSLRSRETPNDSPAQPSDATIEQLRELGYIQ